MCYCSKGVSNISYDKKGCIEGVLSILIFLKSTINKLKTFVKYKFQKSINKMKQGSIQLLVSHMYFFHVGM